MFQDSLYLLILLMLKSKARFYQLTSGEKEEQQISSIYKMISNQQKTMDQILTKYNGLNTQDRWQNKARQSKTLQVRSGRELSSSRQKEKSRNKNHQSSLDLPVINSPNSTHIKKKKQRFFDFKPTPYFSELKNTKQTQKMKQILEKAYLTEALQKTQKAKSKISSQKLSKKNEQRMTLSKISVLRQNQQTTKVQLESYQNKKVEKDIPKPLGYIKTIQGQQEEELSSNQEDVPLSFYQRQFKGAIRAQCLEQTNFLYFSKNQSMKDWTENLLLMFEKHDKQLVLLRKRCKYLQKFDNSFFSIDIFRND